EDGIRDWSVTGVQTCALPIAVSQHGNGKGHVPRRALPGGGDQMLSLVGNECFARALLRDRKRLVVLLQAFPKLRLLQYPDEHEHCVVDGLGADRLAPPRLVTPDVQRRDGLQASFAAQGFFEVANRRPLRRQGRGLFGALAALGPFLERLRQRPACLVGRQEPIGKRSQESGALRLGLGNLTFPSGLFLPPTVWRSVAEMPYRTYQVQPVSIARHRLCRVAGVLGNEGFEGRIAVTDDVAEVEMLGSGALLPPPPQRRQRNVEAFGRLLFCEIHGPLVHGSLQTA